jgi:hypothetical protein
MEKKNIISILLVVVLIGGFWFLSAKASPQKDYVSKDFNLKFKYPEGYYMKDRMDLTNPALKQLAVVLVEDTERNRDLLDGKVTEATEGPTSITVDVYPNPNNLEIQEWLKQNTNWLASFSEKSTEIEVGGEKALTFNWDGLYAGKSVVLSKNNMAYILSVTWITPEDKMIKDFDKILNNIKFSN